MYYFLCLLKIPVGNSSTLEFDTMGHFNNQNTLKIDRNITNSSRLVWIT